MWITGLPAAAASLALTIGYGAISWSLLESRLLGKSKRKAPLLVKAV
jgi:peptidoglycan/LPS O-acetylase OafA/YrhL